jgi:hypothetical protein
MIPATPWPLAREDPSRGHTAADEYARREFGGPNAGWLLSISDGQSPRTELESETPASNGRFRRLAQVIAEFF